MRGGVFICHASKDAAMAQRAVAALEAAGVHCWIAPRDIDAGENYTQAILDGLESAPAVVLVFSSATNASPHVARELEITVGSGRRIVPVRLEAVEPSGSLRYFIGTAQWLDATAPGIDWAPALVQAVRRAVGQPSSEAPPGLAPVSPTGFTPGISTGIAPDTARPTEAGPPRRSALRAWWPVVIGTALAAVAAVVVTLSLTGGAGSGKDAGREPGADTSSVASSAGTDVSSQGSPTAAAAGPVTCWDNSSAPDAGHCPVPKGRAGMVTVFPALTPDCTVVESPIEGKAEVYECVHDGYLVRFTRWDLGFDKETYYGVENQVPSQPWQIGGAPAGLQWFSIDDDPEETQPYQWSAAYDSVPFSLSVEGDTEADRSAGIAQLRLVPLSRVGLK